MKKTLLISFCILGMLALRASDTLTIRQVFDYNIGDTLDYEKAVSTSAQFGGRYSWRRVITGKQFSLNNDTVVYSVYTPGGGTAQVSYTDLDSPIYHVFGPLPSGFMMTIDSSQLADGRLLNLITITDTTGWLHTTITTSFGQGLGMTDTAWTLVNECTASSWQSWDYSIKLIYYAKGTEQQGTPAYSRTQDPLRHFTPIPEDCAFWNYNLYYNYGKAQIRTGAKVYAQGHTYVELLYRSLINNNLSGDSLLGYFRNDTAAQRTLYSASPGTGNESVLYDFTKPENGNIDPPSAFFWSIDTVSTTAGQRTRWSFSALNIMCGGASSSYIEGIGSTVGLFHRPGYCNSSGCDPLLTSFCQCGQTIYPIGASGSCGLLTGVLDVASDPEVVLTPNPVQSTARLSVPTCKFSRHLFITDLLGHQIYGILVDFPGTTLDLATLPSGLYIWRLESDQGIIQTGKIVKQ
ncbi:MAG: T9SS type A sorting domain-containing protein [Bacteroidetes bacterium]|nr:T9SS type A sorting domain-containing protein [Bacteroidota bacterium]